MTADVKTYTPEQARQAIAGAEAQVLDLREAAAYAKSHVHAAVHAEPGDLDAALAEIGQEAEIIVVADDDEVAAPVIAELRDRGREVAEIDGGMKAWHKEGFTEQPTADTDIPVDAAE